MASQRIQRQIDRLLDEAEEAAAGRNWETVRDRAQHALTFDPDNADATGFLSAAERALGTTTSPSPLSATSPPPTEPQTQPTSFADGRYQVKKFLGEGGKKRVYLAHDATLDRDVAFALIKTEGLDDVGRERISREGQSMGRLGAHPHIVTVFDLGEDPSTGSGQAQGQPYMVAELMGGGDVEALIEEAPENRIPLERALEIAIETCRGLEFAHSRGIVHRDLKPGNVWLTEDPSTGSGRAVAKIGDFGLAVAVDRSRLTQQGMMVGTVSYMPPEQALGGEVTPRSDLYSLGAMLYEMVTGRPPFLGDDSVAIIGQHINTAPVAPTWHNPDCPRPLESLILRLLSKDPSERPESAADVLAALDAVDLTASGEALEDGHAQALDSLAGGVFVGRQREMGELKAALEEALSGSGQLVMLVGEPGIGKTRTAQELTTYARMRGAQVLSGRCYEEQGVPPYWPWVQAIRSYVRERESDALRSEMGSGAAEIAQIVSDVHQKVQGLKPLPEQDSAEAARFRLFDAIATFLKSAGKSQPLVLVLDDLHWADTSSLLLLQFLARELAGSRLLVVGAYRDVELSRQHPLSETLAELTRERLTQRVLLRGLSEEDVGRFIEITSGTEAPPALVSAVHTQTEGNPLFVTEVVRFLVQEDTLAAHPEPVEGRAEEAWTVRIPEGVREVIGRRLNRLSERCNETLTIAAVIGREFELGQLSRLVDPSASSGQGLSQERLIEVLEEALGARVIEELPTAMGRYQFTHALIQETLVDELSLTRRVQHHARIAEALEDMYGADAEAHAAELAHHFGQAQALLGVDRLVHYSLPAGERALGAFAFEEALSHFQRGSTALGDNEIDSTKAALLAGLGRAQGAMFQWKVALANLTTAFDYYAPLGDVDSAVAVAEVPSTDDLEQGLTGASGLLGRALELLPPDGLRAGRLLSTYGAFLGINEGRYEDAREALDRALAIARWEKDPVLEMRTLGSQGLLEGFWLKHEEALSKHLLAIEQAQKLNDPRAETLFQFHAAMLSAGLGDLAEWIQRIKACVEAAQKVRDPQAQALGFRAANMRFGLEGKWQDASESSDRALALGPYDVFALGWRVRLEYTTGEFDDGDRYLNRLIEARQVHESNQALCWLATTIPLAARLSGRLQYLDIAEDAARTLMSSGSANPFYVDWARRGLAFIAVVQADESAAADQYAHIRSDTQLGWPVLTSDLLGLVASTIGRLDEAADHFELAIAVNRKGGWRPELAWCSQDYAEMLLERDGDGDNEKATVLLDEALAISQELGMRPLMERVLARRDILKA